MPKVSIILAVYNVEKYIRQCLDSLINQTLQDIEIVCTDDGSTDNSLNILKEYQSKDNRIKIIEQENQGPGVARNNAMDAATGEYIMFVDPDDWLELKACELAYNQIEANKNEFVIFDFKYYMDATGSFEENKTNLSVYKDFINQPHINISDVKTNFIRSGYTWGKIFRKQFLLDNSIKFLPYYLTEDIPVIIKALALSKDISIINKPLYIYRQRESSASSSINRWKELIDSRRYLVDFFINNNIKNSVFKSFVEYSDRSLRYWYNRFGEIDSDVKKQFRKEIIEYSSMLIPYMDKKYKFHYFLFKYNLYDIYYKLIRPIGKYCIVLPYRKIKYKILRR